MTDPTSATRQTGQVLGTRVDLGDWADVTERIAGWAARGEARYVSICDAHSVVRATRDPDHHRHLDGADLVLPDGWPVAWLLRRTRRPDQQRLNGPDLMGHVLTVAEQRGLKVYVYGTTPQTLMQLRTRLMARFPRLQLVGLHSPPFRPLTAEEEQHDIDQIHASGAQIVLTGLGCPKEDRWMFRHRPRLQAVTLGIGAGIDFWAGTVPRAPQWMRDHGLEWFFRLCQEPRRLWRRYLVHNTLFIAGALRQLGRHAAGRRAGSG